VTLVELLLFGIATAGITSIGVYGSIFNKIRPKKEFLRGFGELFHCPMCLGFWVGAFLCGLNDYTELFSMKHTLVNYLLCGGIGSAFSYVFAVAFGDHGLKIEHVSNSDQTIEDESCCKPVQQIHNTYCGDKKQWEDWEEPKEASYEQPMDK
jgi:hypothetical protein